MASAVIELTELEDRALRELAMRTGRPAEELLHEAVAQFLIPHGERRKALIQQARGLWNERTDLPALEDLREEFERQGGDDR